MNNSSLFTSKVYKTTEQKLTDFIIGAVLWVVMNAGLVGLGYGAIALSSTALFGDPSSNYNDTSGTIVNLVVLAVQCLPLLLNVGLMIYFGFTRAWIALGMLSVFGVMIMIVIGLGIYIMATCSFQSGMQPSIGASL